MCALQCTTLQKLLYVVIAGMSVCESRKSVRQVLCREAKRLFDWLNFVGFSNLKAARQVTKDKGM